MREVVIEWSPDREEKGMSSTPAAEDREVDPDDDVDPCRGVPSYREKSG